MADNTPNNPFARPSEPVDPRNSKLFASAQDHAFQASPSQQAPQDRKPGSSIPVASARRELRLKHSELRRNVLIAVSIVIGLILALIATDSIKLGTGPQPSFSKTNESMKKLENRKAIVEGKQLEALRELSGKDPLRVYIGGDSLTGSFGDPLGIDLGESGVIKATYDSRPSSGLVNTGFFNWNTHAKQILKKYDPEVFIFMIGTNDASIASASPKSYADSYKEKLNSFLEIVSPKDIEVIFVLAPAMRENALNKNLDKLNDVIYSLAIEKGVSIFESGDVLSPSGLFTSKVKVGSTYERVRAGDGVHITGEGGKLLAKAIKDFMFDAFDLGRFIDSPPILPTKVPGCCTSPKGVPSGTVSPRTTSSGTASSGTSSSGTTTTATTQSVPNSTTTTTTSSPEPPAEESTATP